MRWSIQVVCALHRGVGIVDIETGIVAEWIANPETDMEHCDNRSNDGKCDAAGRFWYGTMNLRCGTAEGGRDGAGSLYCVGTDRSVTRAVPNLTIPNGLAWSSNNDTMYHIDTPTRSIDAYDFDLASGTINNRRSSVRIPDGFGWPGMGAALL